MYLNRCHLICQYFFKYFSLFFVFFYYILKLSVNSSLNLHLYLSVFFPQVVFSSLWEDVLSMYFGDFYPENSINCLWADVFSIFIHFRRGFNLPQAILSDYLLPIKYNLFSMGRTHQKWYNFFLPINPFRILMGRIAPKASRKPPTTNNKKDQRN